MNKQLKIYKSAREIPVYIFYKILQTKNLKFLIKKYNEEKKIDDKIDNYLSQIFSSILNKYNSLSSDSKNIKSMKAKIRIELMEAEYNVVISALKFYKDTEDINFLFLLNEVGGVFRFNSDKKIDHQVNKALASLKGLKMKIKIAKIDYSKKYKLNLDDKKEIDYLSNLESTAINMERALDMKYPINTMKTSLLRWCSLHKLTKDKMIANG